MRKRHLFPIFLLMLFYACDKSDCPYIDERFCDQAYRDSIANDTTDTGTTMGGDTGTVVNGFVIYSPNVFEQYESTVMLEDFTGFRCSNCAPALATGANLKDQWGDRIVVVGYHVFFEFAAPIASPPAPFSTDFRTTEGESYATEFNLPALPNGLINRKDFGTGEIQSVGNWADRVDELMQLEPRAFLRFRDVQLSPDETTLTFNLAVSPIQELGGEYNVTIGIIEDGLIEGQKNGTETIYPFTHNHVFRGNVNGLYGETAITPAMNFEPNSAKLLSYSFPVSPDWEIENCYLFAYLHDAGTREVIQCEESHFLP